MQRSSNIKHATQSQEIGRTSSKFMNLNLGHQTPTGKVEAAGGGGGGGVEDGDGDGDGEWRGNQEYIHHHHHRRHIIIILIIIIITIIISMRNIHI
ncbi:hypothetical protein M5D96_004522 [Drosophila gunungcola]|uniref:Uncharacterized protein n=1 Tax=Drosophila gunungcola TaxID=103775 RepID=A0A9P9YU57_9MUSC|nr:hypothetical protein M5D96_004522 [Drosophila gunungcola]